MRKSFFLLPIAMGVAMVAACVWFSIDRQKFAWSEISSNLNAVVRMKAEAVQAWREDQLGEVAALARRPLLGARLTEWIKTDGTPLDPLMLKSLQAAEHAESFDEILIFDASLKLRGCASGKENCRTPVVDAIAAKALKEGQPQLSEAFEPPAEPDAHIAAAAPIPDANAPEAPPIGVMVTVVELPETLYPLLGVWPGATDSAETYLVEVGEGTAHYISVPRLSPKPRVFASLPFEGDRAALRAIRKATRDSMAVTGVDYRGVNVLARAMQVTDSPWWVVAEIDETEAFAEWHREAVLIALLFALALLLPVMVGVLFWQQRKRQHYADLEIAAAETKRMCRVYNMLSRTNELIIHATGQDELLQGIANIAVDVGGFLFVWMATAEPDGTVKPFFKAGNDQGYIDAVRTTLDPENPRGRGPTAVVLCTGEPSIHNRFLESPDTAPWHEYARRVGVRGSAVFPLCVDGSVYATFNFYATEDDFFGEQEISTLREMMADISFALENLKRNRERTAALAKVKQAEELLRLHSASLEAAANGVVITDLNGGVVWANRAFTELTGYSLEEAVGRNPRVLIRSGIHPEPFYADMWKTILSGKVWQGELTNRRKDGSFYNEHLTITPVRDELGTITHFIAIKQDITEQIRTRKQLEESESRFRKLIEDLSVGVLLQDRDDRVILANHAAVDMLGLPDPLEMALDSGDPRWEILREDNSLMPREEVPSVVALNTGQTVQGKILGVRNLLTRERRWLNVTAAPTRDGAGEISGVLVTAVDVTGEHLANEEVLRAKERLDRAVEAGRVALWEWDMAQGKTEFSDEWYRQLGYEPGELRQDMGEWFERLHPEDKPRVAALEKHLASSTTEHFSHEYRSRHRDGTYRWYLGSVSIKRDEEGRITYMSGANLDIDERKKLEEEFRQAQRMESIGRLAGGVAHDFNNLLSVISGYTELALATLPPENPLCHDLEQVQHAAQRAAELTSQLLAFSRRQILRPKVMDINTAIRNLEKMLRRLVGEDIAFELDLDPGLGKSFADPGQVDQIFLNLVVNARDAMPYGGKLTIRSESVELDAWRGSATGGLKPGKYAAVHVRDTGTGMTPEVLQRIFEPFFTTKEQGKGTGLGLATVYGIVQQSGGAITVNSTPGEGTEFILYLPMAEDQPAGPDEGPNHDLPPGKESILLVEDEPALRELTRRTLAGLGYAVTVAASGDEALERFHAAAPPIDLLLSDVVMPGMSGPQLAEHLRVINPALHVVFMTGYTDEAIVQHGVLQEGVHLINKPARAQLLAKTLRDILDGSKAATAQ